MNIQRYAYILLFLVLLVYILVEAQQILAPLCWAAFFAILLLPVVRYLEQLRFPRWLAAVLSITVFTLIIAGIVFFLSSEVVSLVSNLPDLGAVIQQKLANFRASLAELSGLELNIQPRQIAGSAEQMLNSSLSSLGQTLTSTAITVTYLTLMPLFIFLFLYYREVYFQFFLDINKQQAPQKTERVMEVIRDVLQNYLVGMGFVTLIMGVLFTAVLTILGIEYALFFAAFLAIFNLIPYVGVFLSSLVTVLYAYLTHDTLLIPFLTLALLWGLQIIENNFITPFVLGSKVQANPLAVIIALLAGGMIWGVSGMVLFVPLVGALRAVFDEFEETKPYALLLGERPRGNSVK
jgi:predicted PurR-regulated permease PerM